MNIGVLFAIGVMICWAFADVLLAHGTRKSSPLFTAAIAQLAGLIVLLLVAPFWYVPFVFTAKTIMLIIISGITGSMALFFFLKGMETGKLNVVVPLATTYPVLIVLVSILLLGNTLTPLQFLAVAFTIGGSIVLSVPQQSIKGSGKGQATIFALAASASWAAQFIILDPLLSTAGRFSPLIFVQAITTATLFACYYLTHEKSKKPAYIPTITGGLLQAVAFILYGLAVTTEQLAIVAPVAAATPLLTVILARILLKESTRAYQWAAIACVLAGMVVLSR